MVTFADAGISPRTLAALERHQISTPVAVQAEALPALLEGADVVIQAPTGSGKTLAFLIPLVEGIGGPAPGPRAVVVTPTRELARQVASVLAGLDSPARCALLYGGVGYATQTLALKQGVDVVIGTPGRILDMIGRKLLSLSRVQYLVLDEGDAMLDVGFAPDLERIIGLTYDPQIVLASATMPEWVDRMIQRHLKDPVRIQVQGDAEPDLEHGLVRVSPEAKLRTLSRLLHRNHGAIVFGRTRHGVRKLNRDLKRLGHNSVELQGDMPQRARERTLESFRNGGGDVLVATNVAARGLDMSRVGLVVNYELPESPQWLTHRIGRTARMGVKGRALTFLTHADHEAWGRLRRQGAPDLAELDTAHLLEAGTWRYLERSAAPVPMRRAPRRR